MKEDYIRIRIDKESKDKFREYCKDTEQKTMSKFLIFLINEFIKEDEEDC